MVQPQVVKQALVHPSAYVDLAGQWEPYYKVRPDADYVVRMMNRIDTEHDRDPHSLDPPLVFKAGQADAKALWRPERHDDSCRQRKTPKPDCHACILDRGFLTAKDRRGVEIESKLARAWDRGFRLHQLRVEHRPLNGAIERRLMQANGGGAPLIDPQTMNERDLHTGYIAPYRIYVRYSEPDAADEPLWRGLAIEDELPAVLAEAIARPVGDIYGDLSAFFEAQRLDVPTSVAASAQEPQTTSDGDGDGDGDGAKPAESEQAEAATATG